MFDKDIIIQGSGGCEGQILAALYEKVSREYCFPINVSEDI